MSQYTHRQYIVHLHLKVVIRIFNFEFSVAILSNPVVNGDNITSNNSLLINNYIFFIKYAVCLLLILQYYSLLNFQVAYLLYALVSEKWALT